jgi:hypothetical protein
VDEHALGSCAYFDPHVAVGRILRHGAVDEIIKHQVLQGNLTRPLPIDTNDVVSVFEVNMTHPAIFFSSTEGYQVFP